jgi:glycosyltransferase involved in cell wall biosynthesis
VHTYHGHVFDGYFGSPSTRLFLLVERWLGRRTDALVAISPQIRHDLLHTYRIGVEERTHLIPLGFNLDRFLEIHAADRERARAALQLPDDAVVIATVGRLTAIKQHSLFLEMAARLAATDDRLIFLIVGDGELRWALEAQASALAIRARVRFLGWRGDLDRVYGATDIFVLTSRNEGTPVALIEAMASGVAVVSTDVGGVRDVVADSAAGTLVPFEDHDALIRAVKALADSPNARTAAGTLGRETVRQRFDLRRLAGDIQQLYSQLLQQR